ncbi:MAG: PP2C family protein-serine/threonine phosphatase [Ruminococcus sp.]|nr:PP2C family protein-serine/threonine phosphatase [Ruminococcus sp.]
MKKFSKWRRSMAFSIIRVVVVLLVVFGMITGALGYISFSEAFKKEYTESTFHMADTATALINGDNVENYLDGIAMSEYKTTKNKLDIYCKKMNVTLLYLIKVDTRDYGRFESVFNSVNNSVGDADYTPWELGYKRDTTNDEYREKYRKLYNKESRCETVYRNDYIKLPHITTMVPVYNSNGRVTSILCVQRPMSEINTVGQRYLRDVLISTFVLIVIFVIFASLYIRKKFVKPIGKVSREATRFARENTKDEPIGNISKITEIYNLASSIDKMETDMLSYIDNLTAITSEKERLAAELSIAAIIQENSIPTEFPAFPDRNEFDIYASMTPAKEVGGDFYNFFMIDDDHLALVIGDVSGKGIPAALFMMVTNILLSERAKMGSTPAEILSCVNENLCEHNTAEMFVTIWLGILEISTGKVIAANAGHEDFAVCRKDGNFELNKTKHGFVVGGIGGIVFNDFEFKLNDGDKLFIYTDGVPEATDNNENMFGLDSMTQALNEYKEGSPKQILDGVRCAVNDFVGSAPQFDDLTMLCIEYKAGSKE